MLAQLEDAARRGLVPASPVHALERGEIGIQDFERLLPACRECYVPSLGPNVEVRPFSLPSREELVTPAELQRRIKHGEPVTVLDVRQPATIAADPRTLPGALQIPPDQVAAFLRNF